MPVRPTTTWLPQIMCGYNAVIVTSASAQMEAGDGPRWGYWHLHRISPLVHDVNLGNDTNGPRSELVQGYHCDPHGGNPKGRSLIIDRSAAYALCMSTPGNCIGLNKLVHNFWWFFQRVPVYILGSSDPTFRWTSLPYRSVSTLTPSSITKHENNKS